MGALRRAAVFRASRDASTHAGCRAPPRPEILLLRLSMTHVFLPAFLPSLPRRVALRPLSSSTAVSLPPPPAPRTPALLLASAALGSCAALPLTAHARVKTTPPSVNVTTV